MIEQRIINFLRQEEEFISSLGRLENIENNKSCVDGKIIGTGRADYTTACTVYNLSVKDRTVALFDIPGIEGDESRFKETIQNALEKAHTIFYVNGSSKKIEKETLGKIKSYMHDNTAVYAIFNVHCKAKKERLPGIDKTYSEELAFVYQKRREIIDQTESELRPFLGRNYKKSIALNGLLSFCGLAVDGKGQTTIVDEKDKNLRLDQKKYFKEYANSADDMVRDGRIGIVKEVIEQNVGNFDKLIYEENIKKLRNRFQTMYDDVEELKRTEKLKIDEFIQLCGDYETRCCYAKNDCVQKMNQIGYDVTRDAFEDVKSDLFRMIEENGGKIKEEDVQSYFNANKDDVIEKIQRGINNKITEAQNDYQKDIKEAQERLIEDFNEFEEWQIEISDSLSDKISSLKELLKDGEWGNGLKINWGSFWGNALDVLGLAFNGWVIGGLFTSIGNIVGALAGLVVGIIGVLWNYFAPSKVKISEAKKRVGKAIDEKIDEISKMIKDEMAQLEYEDKLEKSYDQIRNQAESQIEALGEIENILTRISRELAISRGKIS